MDRAPCPVVPFDRAPDGYAADVCAWLDDPHAHFRAFGPEARDFQSSHRSQRLRTMTLVAPAAEFVPLRPACVSLDRSEADVASWEEAFAVIAERLVRVHPRTFAALQAAGELAWMGCPAGGEDVVSAMDAGRLKPTFADLAEVVRRIQWLFLMCGVRLNEVVVQVDPYTDASWWVRREELRRKRDDERQFMQGRRSAQKAWAAAFSGEGEP